MSELPDMSKIAANLGADEPTIKRWEDEGLIKSVKLPAGSLRPVTKESLDRRAAEGTLYITWPEGLIRRLTRGVEPTEPPTEA